MWRINRAELLKENKNKLEPISKRDIDIRQTLFSRVPCTGGGIIAVIVVVKGVLDETDDVGKNDEKLEASEPYI